MMEGYEIERGTKTQAALQIRNLSLPLFGVTHKFACNIESQAVKTREAILI